MGTTSEQRQRAFRELGHEVAGIDTEPPSVRAVERKLLYRVQYRLLRSGIVPGFHGVPDRAKANQQILERTRSEQYDVLWLDKGLTISAATLREVKRRQPECLIGGYCCDDMMHPANQSRQFLEHLGMYDAFFTTKTYNVQELMALGCRRPIFMVNTYDPATHRPVGVTASERAALGGEVGCIGAWERPRAEVLNVIAKEGISVRVWGNGWQKMRHRHERLVIEGRPLWAESYAKGLCSFDICLGFLCKANRDLQTHRSVEIPACQAFLLAERTTEHAELFEEGREAEYFGSTEELLRKIRYYLAHPDERKRIAAAGRERCLRSGYSNQEKLKWALAKMLELED